MKSSLETTVESYFLELFQTQAGLKGKIFAHEDDDKEAKANCIIVGAKQGQDCLEGPRSLASKKLRSKVAVSCSYRGTTSSAKKNDAVLADMLAAIQNAGSIKTATQRTPGFYLLIMNEEMESNRERSDNVRTRSVEVPCEAGLSQE